MRDSVEMVKEQLRMQAKELRRRDSEKAKNEAKVKHVLKISQKKIHGLQKDIKEEVEKAKYEQFLEKKTSITENADKESKNEEGGDTKDTEKEQELIKELKEQLEKAEVDRDELAKNLKKIKNTPAKKVIETKEVIKEVKDEKLVKAVKKLKIDNEELKQRIDQNKTQVNSNDKEKELLALEVKRLRTQPNTSTKLKKQVKQQEKKHKKSIESFEKLINEKEELIKSFEKVIYDATEGEDKSKTPSEIIKTLKTNLGEVEAEKKELQEKLEKEKNNFKKKLEEEIIKIEEEWGKKLKKAKPKKAQAVEECEEGAPLWMATFSDMVTLVLVFFILMYAIASKNVQTFKSAIIGAEAKSIGVLEALNAVEVQERMQHLQTESSDDILSEMNAVAEETDLDVNVSESKVVVRVPGASLFKPGGADLQSSSRSVLDEVIRVVNKHPDYKIHIQGHTDDEPISTEKFPTNWELSAARATAVLRYFYDKGGEPERMTATGYADTFPLARNDTEFGRAKNRRVEFVLEKEK